MRRRALTPAPGLNLLVLTGFAAALWGCSRCNSEVKTVDAAMALDRFLAEPASVATKTGKKLVYYDVEVDDRGLLLPQSKDAYAFSDVVDRGFSWLVAMPSSAKIRDDDEGKKLYYFSSQFTPTAGGLQPSGWAHNPTGLSAMLVRSALRYRDYSLDGRALDDARAFVDYVLAHGRTEASDAWALVPYASADPFTVPYRGAHDERYCDPKGAHCGRGDGPGFLEPDKVGEFGHALVLLYEVTGEEKYVDAAVRCADALSKHVREGDRDHSPWPFRVDARTNTMVRDPYSSNVIWAVQLFDELQRLGRGSAEHRRARDLVLGWLENFPMKNMRWQGFFEDIPNQTGSKDNPNQYSAGETARYFLRRNAPGDLDRAKSLVRFIQETFVVHAKLGAEGTSPAVMHGAETVSEQKADMAKMGSHTARYASLLAAIYERTGDASFRERARRSFAWATYCIDPSGVVKVGPDDGEGFWFSDGYGDYMIHFLDGMASVPAWVPADRPHVLRSGSVLRSAKAEGAQLTYDPVATGIDEVVVPSKAISIRAGGQDVIPLDRRSLGAGEWLRIERKALGRVTIGWTR